MEGLKKSEKIPFSKIFLDPNNPRLAAEDAPGYNNPSKIFDDEIQTELNKRVADVYEVEDLERSILTQGWVPIDAMIVWEHPKKAKHYIVVEGNTRTVVLRGFRDKLETEKKKLDKLEKNAKKFTKEDIDQQRRKVTSLKKIVAATDELEVLPVNAKTADELLEQLPRILAVRHISRAKNWSPYAQNLYILDQYRSLYNAEHPGKDLALVSDLIEQIGGLVSLGATKTRRAIQEASAFSHLKRNFDDQLTKDDTFKDEDQYYFDNILQNRHAAEQFGFGKEDLHLSDEAEKVLFNWAFKYPRGDGDANKNILRKAEDIRLWARMKKYDDEKGTAFAAGLDVENPDQAVPMDDLEARFLAHKAQISPVDTLRGLLDSLTQLKADALLTQAAHIRPMLAEVAERVKQYLAMIDAVGKKVA
ncbi:MAG: hypothetical protein K8M05_25030 [Deltaproteobacteria bacterium]|nr:hypothetical protein [Kofleriaceae bacterium]